jgi:uncharacterized membrane protein YcaP (DUF421 family)
VRHAVDIVISVAYVYFVLMVALRVMGKRELSELSPFELVTLLLIPEIFSASLSRGDFSLTRATVGVATLLTLVFLTSLLTFRWRRLERVVEGDPTVLVHNGRFIEKNLCSERVTPAEVFAEMHKSGVEELHQVRWAILEVDGKIAIISESSEGNTGNSKDERVA